MSIKLAVISDIHGNIWALESVLEDIQKRGVTSIVNLPSVHRKETGLIGRELYFLEEYRN